MADNTFRIPITADDKTAKGVGSAGKRFSELRKDASKADGSPKRWSDQVAAMEKATAKTLRFSSVTERLSGRFSALREASSSLTAAKEASSGLGGLLPVVASGFGLVAGAAIAAGAAVIKTVDDVANRAAKLGRLGQNIDMSTEDITAFEAVGGRNGMSKDEVDAGLSGFAKSNYETALGLNPQAQQLLTQQGIKFNRTASGSIDNVQAAKDISRYLQSLKTGEQRQRAAGALGAEGLLPLLQNGNLGAGLAQAREEAPIITTPSAEAGRRYQAAKARTGQILERRTYSDPAQAGVGHAADIAEVGAEALKNGVTGVGQIEPMAKRASQQVAAATGVVSHALTEGAHGIEGGFGQVNKTLGAVAQTIWKTAVEAGIDPRQATTVARIESHFDPTARPGINKRTGKRASSARGTFQFLDKTAERYGLHGTDRDDPRLSTEAYAREMKAELPGLERRLGRKATPEEAYMLHQQGEEGAFRIISAPASANAVDTMGREDVVKGNAGRHYRRDMTMGEFRDFWEKTYAASDVGPGGGQTPKAELHVKMTGLPPGTVTSVKSVPGVNVRVETSMASP